MEIGDAMDPLYFIISISILGLVSGIISLKYTKSKSIGEIVLSIILPIVTYFFLSTKTTHAYGGSNFKYLVDSAINDEMLEPIIIFLMLILLIFLISNTLTVVFIKDKKHKIRNIIIFSIILILITIFLICNPKPLI